MRVVRLFAARPYCALAVVCAVALVALAACAQKPPPTLTTALADQARDVAVDDPLAVTTTGAVLDRITLERIDTAAPAPQFSADESRAQLTAPLAPDARYRLTAEAHALSDAPRPPWQAPETIALTLTREFSTVHAPVLQAPSEPLTAYRGKPIDLRFSEPLAQVRLADAPAGARGYVADDPHVFRVEFGDLAPGEDFALQLTDVRGRNGAPGADQTLAVRTPEAVDLMAVNGVAPGDRVVVPPGAPVALEWSAPLTTLRYRLADKPVSWTGAPTNRIDLPLTLDQGQSRTLEIEDAVDADGGWLPSPMKLELAAPEPLRLAAMWPEDGATGISPDGDPTFRFSEPVASRDAVESAISFDPPIPGKWEWLAPNKLHFLPDGQFPHESRVTVHIQGGPTGPVGASGSYLAEPVTSSFQTGKLKTIEVWLGQQRMVLTEDGEVVHQFPVATGVKGAETPPGTYSVLYKMPIARFVGTNPNGSHYDIPDVHWVLPFYGDYTIHGAYWRHNFGTPGSAGCVSLTDANAKVVYDWADVGTRVEIHP
ncbi:MAG TPA: L,D-transpeptidase family protein [Chloroflexota bacterium]|nr:L,D-transpeptidase family protein [Chloroflexota bacterium]